MVGEGLGGGFLVIFEAVTTQYVFDCSLRDVRQQHPEHGPTVVGLWKAGVRKHHMTYLVTDDLVCLILGDVGPVHNEVVLLPRNPQPAEGPCQADTAQQCRFDGPQDDRSITFLRDQSMNLSRDHGSSDGMFAAMRRTADRI